LAAGFIVMAFAIWGGRSAGSAAEGDTVKITDADIRNLVEIMDRDRQRWIDGLYDPEAEGEMTQDPAMTLLGPFGGPARTGGAGGAGAQRQANSAFKGGTGSTELVSAVTGGDLVVLVLIERNEVMFEGRSEPHRWELRTTQVFRRAGDRWIRLHRHADPLLRRRSLDETLALIGSE
jgi:ketosteroid isomerase-like protein